MNIKEKCLVLITNTIVSVFYLLPHMFYSFGSQSTRSVDDASLVWQLLRAGYSAGQPYRTFELKRPQMKHDKWDRRDKKTKPLLEILLYIVLCSPSEQYFLWSGFRWHGFTRHILMFAVRNSSKCFHLIELIFYIWQLRCSLGKDLWFLFLNNT